MTTKQVKEEHRGQWWTLRFRFALWTASLLLAALVLFSVFVYVTVEQSLYRSVDDTLRSNAVQASGLVDVEDGQLDLPNEDIEIQVYTNLALQGLVFRFFDLEGTVLLSYGNYPNLPVHEPSLAAARQERSTFATVSSSLLAGNVRLYTTPIIYQDRLVGIAQVGQSLAETEATLANLRLALAASIPLLVVVAGLGGYGLATHTLNPIDRIIQTARRISGENLSHRLNLPPTNDEVGRLAATFDAMLARLDESFQRERQFIADASHEFRTPLATMQVILSTVLAKRRSIETYQGALTDLAEETNRLQLLTETLLFLARHTDGSNGVWEPVDLSILLEDVIASLQPLAEAKGLTLIGSITEGLVLTGDTDSLVRLFVNLVDNAIRYTEEGEITVNAAPTDNGRIQVAVTDTGCGIAVEHYPKLFDRFYRVDKSRTSSGTGLGLAIARDVVKTHDGTITVQSAVGAGTTFTVQLPLMAKQSNNNQAET